MLKGDIMARRTSHHRAEHHLYREGAKSREKRKFEERYGKKKGDRIYGAVVGKVKRERERKHR